MRARVSVLALLAIAALAAPTRGDWDVGDEYKWVQMPDLTTMGMDVNATAGETGDPRYILADDFLCTVTGPITDIHVWGSWRYDYLPFGFDPGAVTFMVSILSDIPANESPTGYSMPDQVLWSRGFGPGDFVVREWAASIAEWWWGGEEEPVFPGDTVCWQYNFLIPIADAFVQQGAPGDPAVYWLAIHALPEDLDPQVRFGWKTSETHWNDAAVWNVMPNPGGEPWRELRYPFPHPYEGQAIDLAFVITGPVSVDWGDAPTPAYPTLLASDGARHTVVAGMSLGAQIDAEADGQPSPNADGDDLNGLPDEDGVAFIGPLPQGGVAQVNVTASAPGLLDAWVDFNRDGDWADASERIFTNFGIAAGGNLLGFNVPLLAQPGQTFTRFRFSTQGVASYTGLAPDGEVEDHVAFIEGAEWKWIQTPDLGETGIDVNASQDFILADDYLCDLPGRVTGICVWGSWLNDHPPFGAPMLVNFTLSIHADIPADTLAGTASRPGEVLWTYTSGLAGFTTYIWQGGIAEGWMDPPDQYAFPGDWTCWVYSFSIPPEQAFHQTGTPDSPVVYWLDVHAMPLETSARFGWKTSLDHWNDDAAWGQGVEPYHGPWTELRYPPQHQMFPQSIDLAFSLQCAYGTDVPEDTSPRPHGLFGNVPNPFNPSTTVRYDVPPGGGQVTIEVFDVSGRLVRTLVDERQIRGAKSVGWDGRDRGGVEVGSGVYFCRLRVGNTEQTVKMTLLR